MGFNLASVFHLKAQGSIWLLFVFFWVVRRALPYFTACFVAIELVVRRAVFNWIFPVG